MAWQALIVPIGAGVFAAVVKEALIVILGLKRLNLFFDKGIEHSQIICECLGQGKIHGRSSHFFSVGMSMTPLGALGQY